ncbi:MAG: hypothetical protein ACRC3H_19255 [Lachnospiraceae bacterium]
MPKQIPQCVRERIIYDIFIEGFTEEETAEKTPSPILSSLN